MYAPLQKQNKAAGKTSSQGLARANRQPANQPEHLTANLQDSRENAHASPGGTGVQPTGGGNHFRHNFADIPVFHQPVRGIQAKLTVNVPGDAYEQEADQVAEQVMRMPKPQAEPISQVSGRVAGVQRECACGGSCDDCKKNKHGEQHARVQMKAAGPMNAGGMEAPPIVHEVLRSPGQPLDAGTRSFMEPRFGHDFSKVRVHTDARAAESAKAVGAEAYAMGQHIVFGKGRYAPLRKGGARLLAHELAHTIQQQNSPVQSLSKFTLDGGGDSYEHAADAAADAVLSGRPAPSLNTAPAGVQRQRITNIERISDDERLIHYDNGTRRRIQRIHTFTVEIGPANWAQATPGIDQRIVWLEIEWCAGQNHGTVRVGANIPEQVINFLVQTITSGGDVNSVLRGVSVTPFVQLNVLQSRSFQINARGEVTVDIHGRTQGGEVNLDVSSGPYSVGLDVGSRDVSGRPDVHVGVHGSVTPEQQTPEDQCQGQRKHVVEHIDYQCQIERGGQPPSPPRRPPRQPEYVPLFFNYANSQPRQPEYGNMLQEIVRRVEEGYTIASIEGETSPEGPREGHTQRRRAPGTFVNNEVLARYSRPERSSRGAPARFKSACRRNRPDHAA